MIVLIIYPDLVGIVYILITVAGLNPETVSSLPGDINVSPIDVLPIILMDPSFLAIVIKTQDQIRKEVMFYASEVLPGFGIHVMAHDLALVGVARLINRIVVPDQRLIGIDVIGILENKISRSLKEEITEFDTCYITYV